MNDRVIGRVHKIDIRKNAKAKVYYESRRDLLTGLLNKGYTHSYIDNYIKENSDSKAAIIIIDIDNFKLVNDHLGHLFGDEVIRNVAKALTKCCSTNGIIGRVGGDEFVVFLKNYSQPEQVSAIAKQICSSISAIYVGEQNHFTLSASIGIALFPEHGHDLNTLFDNADKALFHTKKNGKDGFSFFDPKNEDILNALNTERATVGYTTFDNTNISKSDSFGYELTDLAFKLMDDSRDVDSTINLLLRTIATHYDISVISIREVTENPREMECIYECATGTHTRCIGTRWTFSEEAWAKTLTQYTNGYYINTKNSSPIFPENANELELFDIKSILQIPIYSDNAFLGCVDFISIDKPRKWTQKEISVLKMFCRILSSYLLNMRAFKRTENLMEQMNAVDSLTGLMKYDYFINVVKDYIANNTDPNRGLAIVYSDIRFFKLINDKYGYSVGDSLLEYFADTIKTGNSLTLAACRVYSDNIVSAVAYNNARDPEDFARLISEHNHKVEEALQHKFLNQHVVINTGIFIAHDTKGLDAEIAISNANMARKQAKASEASDAILFTSDMITNLVQQMELSSSLPHAIETEELKVYYQPKIECGSEKVIGAEALVRWVKPDGSFIFPDQFIPLFESNGLIVEVDYFVYKKVFQHIKGRLDENLPVVPISMNVSRVHLVSDGIIDYIESLFKEYPIPAALIEFELTENIYIENMSTVLPLVEKFRSMGIKISMDDFGSGHSSLNELNSLPIDTLKLDKVFMTDTLNQKQQIILSSIVEMAKKLNIAVLCEGVENNSQNEFLRRIGCDMVQGYYYSKPLCEKDFIEYIKNRLTESIDYIHFAFDNSLMDDSEQFEGKIIGDGVQFTKGPANMSALHFDGGSLASNIVEFPTDIYPVSNYTITMWFKEDVEQMWSTLMYTSFENGFSSIIPHAFDLKSMFRIKDFTDSTGAWTDASSVLAPRKGVWNFIAASYNFRTQTSNLYINGLPAGKFINAPLIGQPLRVMLGGDIYQDSFKGSIADFRIYNQELSQIENMYAFNEFNH